MPLINRFNCLTKPIVSTGGRTLRQTFELLIDHWGAETFAIHSEQFRELLGLGSNLVAIECNAALLDTDLRAYIWGRKIFTPPHIPPGSIWAYRDEWAISDTVRVGRGLTLPDIIAVYPKSPLSVLVGSGKCL